MPELITRSSRKAMAARHRMEQSHTGTKALRHLGFVAAGTALTSGFGFATACLGIDAVENTNALISSGTTATLTGSAALFLGAQTAASVEHLYREARRGLHRLRNRVYLATHKAG